MTFVITETCIDEQDQSCVEVCPVDCIHFDEGSDRMLYIDPVECIDCGACEPVCPVDAIFVDSDVPDGQQHFTEINVLWFADKDAARARIADVPAREAAAAAAPAADGDAAPAVAAAATSAGPAATAVATGSDETEQVVGSYKIGEAGIEGKCALCGTYVIKGGANFRQKSVICSDCAGRSERAGSPYAKTAGRR